MADGLLLVSNLSVRFGGLLALDGVALEVRDGRSTAILGPNGAGKTTLFNAVAGAVRPSEGRILFAGDDITSIPPHRRCRKGISRTFQITQPFSGLNVIENVAVAIVSRGVPMAAALREAADYVAFVGLEAKSAAPARTLSTGQRKRLELARALATRPRLLLLDEVTGGVDQPSVPELLDLIRRLRVERGITVLVIEHKMDVLHGLADDAIFLDRGRVVTSGSMADIAAHDEVRRIYLGDADAAA
ncbi:ABC transporter ATP-binding protein [uncultured Jannaschia sp.]|uniref:ABC transporter ATP-binding protein n=1 Tax=uncultured Jannaschia sp. TaxID=293347 RepID=UPI002634205C|nr:ABC transporter ATP-binding protein [uncultured Jannaschia sp.]